MTARALLARLALVAAFAPLPGCIKSDSKATLEKSGKGTLSQSLVLDLAVMNQLKEMAKEFGMGAGGGVEEPKSDATPAPALDPEELRARLKAAKGIELKKAEHASSEGKETMSVEVAFEDLAEVAKAGLFGQQAVSLEKDAATGNYTLKFDLQGGMGAADASAPETPGAPGAPGTPETPGAPDAPPMGPEAGGMDPQMIAGMLEPFLGGLEMKFSLTLPTAIRETNGTKDEAGTTVSWKAGFKELSAGKTTWTVTFSGEGLEWKPFRHKPDPKEMMEKFEGKPKPAAQKPAEGEPGMATEPKPPAPAGGEGEGTPK